MSSSTQQSSGSSSARSSGTAVGSKRKARSTKTVEVKLTAAEKKARAKKAARAASKRKPRKAAASSGAKAKRPKKIAKSTVEAKTKKATATKPSAAKGSKKVSSTRATKAPAPRAAATEATKAADQSQEIDLTSPPERVLRSFRQAAEQNRKEVLQKKRALRAAQANFLAKPPRRGKKFEIDLRVHAPGTIGYFQEGGVDAGPALVRLAKVKGLDMLAITDFYDGSYLDVVQPCAEGSGLTLLPGVMLRCHVGECRDVFMIALFPEDRRSDTIFDLLQAIGVPEAAYGDTEYQLSTPIADVIKAVEERGGLLIPSRLDKTPYRQLAIPALVEEYGFRAFDLVHPDNREYFKSRWPDGGFTFFTFSSANALAQIGSRAGRIKLATPNFEGFKERAQRVAD